MYHKQDLSIYLPNVQLNWSMIFGRYHTISDRAVKRMEEINQSLWQV